MNIAFWTQQGEFLLRMTLGALCGALIGFERKSRMKEAGVRTHLIVALGSTLMMLVSKYGFFDVVVFDSISLDCSRIAANIITGVSFLGAGVIFVKGRSVSGLTTAAGIWATSGVGLAIGAGMYAVGVAATGFILLIQVLLHGRLRSLEGPCTERLYITMDAGEDATRKLREQLDLAKVTVQSMRTSRNDDGTLELELTVWAGHLLTPMDTSGWLLQNAYLRTVEII